MTEAVETSRADVTSKPELEVGTHRQDCRLNEDGVIISYNRLLDNPPSVYQAQRMVLACFCEEKNQAELLMNFFVAVAAVSLNKSSN